LDSEVLLAKRGRFFISAIQFVKIYFARVSLLHFCPSFRHRFAMSTPWRIKFHEDRLVTNQLAIRVVDYLLVEISAVGLQSVRASCKRKQ
jgi:hypothetical protein